MILLDLTSIWIVLSYDIIAAILADDPDSSKVSEAFGHATGSNWPRICSECTNGFTCVRAVHTEIFQLSGISSAQSWCGAMPKFCIWPSYGNHHMAEFWWSGHTQWYIWPWMAIKPWGPLFPGKGWVDSNDTKEKMRFNILDNADIVQSLMNVLYSRGKGSKGGVNENLKPWGPQQKQDLHQSGEQNCMLDNDVCGYLSLHPIEEWV